MASFNTKSRLRDKSPVTTNVRCENHTDLVRKINSIQDNLKPLHISNIIFMQNGRTSNDDVYRIEKMKICIEISKIF